VRPLVALTIALAVGGVGCDTSGDDAASRPAAAPAPTASTSTSTSTTPTTSTRTTATTTTSTTRAVPRYVFPVDPVSGTSYARGHHDYPATDIFSPCGTTFVAPTAGRVDEVSRVDTWKASTDDPAVRGGLSVSVVGDDGVRYYGSHLREVGAGIDPGRRVRAGDPLGKIGNTGNARGIACHLHFGLSPPSPPGDWAVRRGVVWPWPYLDSWKTGGQRSPRDEVLNRR
jgi:murein DD-endopeptidase MepM/ murein hydrolase activator NlpD